MRRKMKRGRGRYDEVVEKAMFPELFFS